MFVPFVLNFIHIHSIQSKINALHYFTGKASKQALSLSVNSSTYWMAQTVLLYFSTISTCTLSYRLLTGPKQAYRGVLDIVWCVGGIYKASPCICKSHVFVEQSGGLGWWLYSWECIPELLHHVKLSLSAPLSLFSSAASGENKQDWSYVLVFYGRDRNSRKHGKNSSFKTT